MTTTRPTRQASTERTMWNDAALALLLRAKSVILKATRAHCSDDPWRAEASLWVAHHAAFTGDEDAAVRPSAAPLLTCGTCYGSGETSGRDCTSCSIRAPRCPSCDHMAVFHAGPEGCRHAVTVAAFGSNIVCPCTAAPAPATS